MYTFPAILGLFIRYNNIVSLGVSYKPGNLRISTGHTEFQKNITELWLRLLYCSAYVQERQEGTPICGSLNFLTITQIKQAKTEIKLN